MGVLCARNPDNTLFAINLAYGRPMYASVALVSLYSDITGVWISFLSCLTPVCFQVLMFMFCFRVLLEIISLLLISRKTRKDPNFVPDSITKYCNNIFSRLYERILLVDIQFLSCTVLIFPFILMYFSAVLSKRCSVTLRCLNHYNIIYDHLIVRTFNSIRDIF